MWTSTSLEDSLTKNLFSSFPHSHKVCSECNLLDLLFNFVDFADQAISLEMHHLAIVMAQKIDALSCLTIMFSLCSNCNIWPLNVYNWSYRHQFFVWLFLIAVCEKRRFQTLSCTKVALAQWTPHFKRRFAKLFLTDSQVLEHEFRPIKRFSIVGCRIMRITWKKVRRRHG